jgi:NAD dependent epimerase/dehydratase family enzyme
LNNNSYHVSLISSDYFDNQDKINIKLKNVDIVIHIIDDYFYSLKSSNYEKSLDIFSNIMTKIEIAINSNETKPKMFIQTSLSLIYKSKNINDETSISFSNSLISNISNLVEDKANNLREQGVKVAILRMANILSKDGGMINKMNFFSKIRMYPKALKTKKYIDWVHIDDVISSIEFIISNNYFGVFNITSPSLGIYKELSSLIIKDKKIFSLPNFLFKKLFFYGYLVSMENSKIIPKRLLDSGFKFKYEKLSSIENF